MDFGKRGIGFEYHDVRKDAAAMRRFLEHSLGDRRVPLIVEDGKVTVGFGGT